MKRHLEIGYKTYLTAERDDTSAADRTRAANQQIEFKHKWRKLEHDRSNEYEHPWRGL